MAEGVGWDLGAAGGWDGSPEVELFISSQEFCKTVEVAPNMPVLRVPFSCV